LIEALWSFQKGVKDKPTNALVTLNVGSKPEYTLSHGVFRAYCERWGLAFEQITETKIRAAPWFTNKRQRLSFEKYQIGELLDTYERVLYVDGDVLIRAECPNVFEIVAPNQIGCVFEDVGPNAWKRREEWEKVQKRLGPLNMGELRYFNAGVMVVSREHRELFDLNLRKTAHGRWPDQTTFNYYVRKRSYGVCELGAEFNMLECFGEDFSVDKKRRKAYIIHYAGMPNKPYMMADLPIFEEEWERRSERGASVQRSSMPGGPGTSKRSGK
jgi:lipopolysaccharide biosynthesis glycosyltransferase